LTPEYINESWSPEVLWVMFRERLENIRRMNAIASQARREDSEDGGTRRVVSDLELFKKMGIDPSA